MKKACQKAEQWMGRQSKEGCHEIAKYKKLHVVARQKSDWRKNTGEAMARKGKKESNEAEYGINVIQTLKTSLLIMAECTM
jgi:hypothetical protein